MRVQVDITVMALVVICGQPCSGKSKAANCLFNALKESEIRESVKIIDESSLHRGLNESYAGKIRCNLDNHVEIVYSCFYNFFHLYLIFQPNFHRKDVC